MGRDCYYVIMCSEEKLHSIVSSETDIDDMRNHARVLASGFGHTLLHSTIKMLESEYNINPNSLI